MLVNMKEILEYAPKGQKAIPAFNCPTVEAARAAVKAAEECNHPVILAHAEGSDACIPLYIVAPVLLAIAKKATVPVCVHLDHGDSIEYCKAAVDAGFTSIMYDGSCLSYEENVANTQIMREYTKDKNVSLEAELGRLKSREDGTVNSYGAEYTDPDQVADFYAKTQVDLLAISFGTAHGIYAEKPVLSFDVITAVGEKCEVPLVMHGGSGLSDDDYKEVIKRGVRKINYYTYMGQAGYEAVKAYVADHEKGGFHDLSGVGIQGMYEHIINRVKLFKGE